MANVSTQYWPGMHRCRMRPRHDHRMILSGILWVLRTRSSWRDLPLEFGKWETAYKRYRLWQDTGLWQRLLALLGDVPDGEAR